MHPITLTVTTGRSGTSYIANSMMESYLSSVNKFEPWITHEHFGPDIVKTGLLHRSYSSRDFEEIGNISEIEGLIKQWDVISKKAPVVDFGWTMRSLIPFMIDLFGERLNILFVHRDPISVASSFSTMGAYQGNKRIWSINPFNERMIHQEFQERWGSMTRFEKSLYMWLETAEYAKELQSLYPGNGFFEVASSALFSNPDKLTEVAKFCGFPHKEIVNSKSTNSLMKRSLERYPLKKGEELLVFKHPEILEMADVLGYSMTTATVASIGKKYYLPNRLLSKSRHYSGYWQLREYISSARKRFLTKTP